MKARRIIAFIAAAWRAGEDLPLPEKIDDLITERRTELDVHEAIGLARGLAIRQGERELAAALQAVLLLHLTGGSLAPVAALVAPPQSAEAVN